jgi:hypothetical protein
MIAAVRFTDTGREPIPEVVGLQLVAFVHHEKYAVFPWFFRRLRGKPAFSLEDCEDCALCARMQSSEIFGFY